MFSLDVSSLFTNIPLKETIEFLCEFMEHNAIDVGLPLHDLKVLLYRCTQNVQFKFNNDLYSQIDGVAMGSPLGPLLADVFMAKVENDQLKTTINKCCVYKRYVDDIWCLVDRSQDPMTILSMFNAAHANIKFTIETESNGQLAFLDVCLKRRPDGTVRRTMFRKATWTDQYIHFKSFVPLKHKANLIACLTDRARKICSEDALNDELAFLRKIFLNNGYPQKLIERKMQIKVALDPLPTVEKKNVYISLPFKGDTLSLSTERKLSTAINQAFGAAQLKVFYNSTPVIILLFLWNRVHWPHDQTFVRTCS